MDGATSEDTGGVTSEDTLLFVVSSILLEEYTDRWLHV